MKTTSALLLLMTIASHSWAQQPNPNVWTKEYEQRIYSQMYEKLLTTIKDDEQRKQFCNCFIDKGKKSFPNGMEGVNPDSANRIGLALGKECYNKLKNPDVMLSWSPENLASFRKAFLEDFKDNPKVSVAMANKLCDCVIAKLKVIYPDLYPSIPPDTVQDKVINECVKEVYKKDL